MSLFQSPDRLASTNGGAVSFTVVEQPPDQGAVSGARPGKSGLATGDTIFTLRTDPRFIIFSECYFRIQGHFIGGTTTGANANPSAVAVPLSNNSQPVQIAYCDNWPAALFQTCRVTLNGSQIEQALFNPQTDTVATYSAATHSWLKSYGTASGVGETLKNRLKASAVQPYGTAVVYNGNPQAFTGAPGEVVATFRPPLSIFNCSSAIRGNQWRIIMSWSPTGEQNMVESAGIISNSASGSGTATLMTYPVIAGNDYQFIIDSFTLFVATAQPDPLVPLPKRMLIDLTPCQTTQISITGTNSGSSNVSIPPTTFRMAFALQDNNGNALANYTSAVIAATATTPATTANSFVPAHGTNGIFPITNFTLALSTAAGGSALGLAPAMLNGFRWSSSQLGLSWPIPDYNFTNVTGATAGNSSLTATMSRKGLDRAFRDFIQTSQGDHGLCEGGIPFGNGDAGVPINALGLRSNTAAPSLQADATNFFTVADPENPNAVDYVDSAVTTAGGATNVALPAINMATYGWLGRYPILCSPLVKPTGTNLSQIDVTYNFTGVPASATLFVFAYYGAAAAIEYNEDGSVSRVELQQNV